LFAGQNACILIAMGRDLTDILREWEYDPESSVRIVEADDGRKVLQIRQPLGIEQYEMEGRPDGLRPDGKASLLEVYLDRLDDHKREHGTEDGFTLSHEDCDDLQSESVIFYYRYMVLFQIGDFERTAVDTDHNLEVCGLVSRYAEQEEDKKQILQYRPYILRMNALSKAMVSMNRELLVTARELLEKAIKDIESMPEVDTPTFEVERMRSLSVLRSTLKQVMERKPSPAAQLKVQLDEAVAAENYELAAELRDRIRRIGVEQTE
jgi:hypothetical protein